MIIVANNNTWKCDSCDSTCYTCNGTASNNCLTCKTGLYLTPNTSECVTTCPPGYVTNSTSK